MACPDEELIDPIRGQRLVFRRTAQETHGALVEVEAFYQPTSVASPAHLHPHQEEYFEVLSGSMTIRVNDQENIYHAGQTFGIPAGTAHAMWNGSEAETHLRWQTWPALHTEAFFEIMWGLAQEGKTNKAGVPNLLQLAVILENALEPLIESSFESLVSPPIPCLQPLLIDTMERIFKAAKRPFAV